MFTVFENRRKLIIASQASYVYILSGQKFTVKWSIWRSNSINRQVSFKRTKMSGKCPNWKIQLRHLYCMHSCPQLWPQNLFKHSKVAKHTLFVLMIVYIIPRHDPKLVFVIFNIYYSKMSHDDHILWYGGGKILESSRMMIRVSSSTTSAVISYNIHTSTQYTYICVSKKGGRDIHGVGGWRFGQTSWLDGPCNNNMYFGDKKQSEANLEEWFC